LARSSAIAINIAPEEVARLCAAMLGRLKHAAARLDFVRIVAGRIPQKTPQNGEDMEKMDTPAHLTFWNPIRTPVLGTLPDPKGGQTGDCTQILTLPSIAIYVDINVFWRTTRLLEVNHAWKEGQ
jgi:hypothetical protein